MSKFKAGDIIEYTYQSGGFWRKVRGEVINVSPEDGYYTVRILAVLYGEERLSGGTSLIGRVRTPRIDWVDGLAGDGKKVGITQSEEEKTDESVETETTNDAVNLSGSVKNVDELFEKAGLDKDAWAVQRLTISAREVSEDGEVVDPLFQIWARLEPNKTASFKSEEWQESFFKRIYQSTYAPPPISVDKEEYLLSEVNLSDAHLRMLSWKEETGYNYDLDIASSVLREAGMILIRRSSDYGVSRIKLVIGNDMFHADSNEPFTKRGNNLLDVDSRYQKGFEEGFIVIRDLIEFALSLHLPVDVIPISGNHDAETVYFLGQVLNAHFKDYKHVSVDTSPKLRKYYRWGRCIVGLEHGDRTKKKDAPTILELENPDISWKSHPFREIHLGHIHHEHAHDEKGTVLRWVNALPPEDLYHYSEGYVGSVKGSQAFIFNKLRGLESILYHRVDYGEQS